MPHEAVFQHQGEAQAACLLSILRSYQQELRHGPQQCEEASRPPVCLWRLPLQKLSQWTGSQQTHEDMCLRNCHQRPLQMVGALQWTPSSNTRLRIEEPSDIWRPSHEASTFDHTDHTGLPNVEPGHICPPGCGPYAGGRASSSYLHLLAYKQISFMVLVVLKSK